MRFPPITGKRFTLCWQVVHVAHQLEEGLS